MSLIFLLQIRKLPKFVLRGRQKSDPFIFQNKNILHD